MTPLTVGQALRVVAGRLETAGVAAPLADASLLLGHVLCLGFGEVAAAAALGRALTESQAADLEELTRRRVERVPLQHLTGVAGFRTLTLRVGPGVFVPRPESEITAQWAIDLLGRRPRSASAPVVVDLCTGSGAIALAVATEVPEATVYAVEVSPQAREYAADNLARCPAGARVRLIAGDAREALPELAALEGAVDVVICNPPYIPPDGVPVDPEVRDHDPPLALYGGGPDGLELPVALAARARRLLAPDGWLIMEHGDGQWPALSAALAGQGWAELADHPDLAGRSRVLTAREQGLPAPR